MKNPRLAFWLSALAIACFGVAIAFVLLTLLDHQLDTAAVQRFDLGLQAWVHTFDTPHLTRVMLALTWIGSVRIFVTALLITMIYRLLRHGRHDVVLLLGAMTVAIILNETMKLHFHRARPTVPWSIGDEHTFSFPSGHSLFSVVFYGSLAWCALHRRTSPRRRVSIMIPTIVLPFAIGLSRIYLGMHYPTDVLAGWLTGGIWVCSVIAIDRLWHASRHAMEAGRQPSAQRS